MAATKSNPVLVPDYIPQPPLLRRPRPPTKSSFVELVKRINCETSKAANFQTGNQSNRSDVKLNTFVDSDTQFSDTYLGTSSDRSQESCVVLPASDTLPRHHTSLLEVSPVTVAPRIGRSLVQPLKPRGPAPLIPSRPPRRKPNLIPVPADDDLLKYYLPPEFTLQDFIIKLSEDEHIPVEQVERTVYSTFTYTKLQRILHERCQPRNTRISTHELCWPADVPAAVSRVPQKQLLIEMAAIIKEHLNKVSGVVMKSSFRPLPTGQKFGTDSSACAEIVFYRDVMAETEKQFTQQVLETEQPGTDSVIHGPTTKHFNGSKRTASPFATIDEGLISPRELGVLDSLLNGGRALSLKAQFISMLPDVQLLLDTIEYINLSYNNFQAIPTEIFSMSCLTVLLLRNNPLREIPTDIEHLQNLTICVFSFCQLTTLPYELFTLPHLLHLDVSYNTLSLVPSDIRHSTSLEELNVQGNQLMSLPMNILQLNNLKRLQVANNFMHPLFWRNAVTNQPQSLAELSSVAVCRLKSVDDNNSSQQLLLVVEKLNSSCVARCDVCKGPRFGRGMCAVRPVSRLCGVRNIPILFQCCSVECKNRFMFAVDEELTDLLYGPKARTSR